MRWSGHPLGVRGQELSRASRNRRRREAYWVSKQAFTGLCNGVCRPVSRDLQGTFIERFQPTSKAPCRYVLIWYILRASKGVPIKVV